MNTSKRLSFGGCCAAAMLVWAVASPLVGQPLNRTNLTPKESVFAELNDSRFLDRQAEWGTRCKTPDPNCAPLVILDWDCRNLPNPNPNETPEQCVARKFKEQQRLTAEKEQAERQAWDDLEKKQEQEKREREQQESDGGPGDETSEEEEQESSVDVDGEEAPDAASDEVSEDETTADTTDMTDEPEADGGNEETDTELEGDVSDDSSDEADAADG